MEFLEKIIRNALIIAGISLLTVLQVQGYPPTYESIYIASINGILIFLIELAHAYGIDTQIKGYITGKKSSNKGNATIFFT